MAKNEIQLATTMLYATTILEHEFTASIVLIALNIGHTHFIATDDADMGLLCIGGYTGQNG